MAWIDRSAICILAYRSPQLLEGLDEEAEGRSILVAATVRGSVAAAFAAFIMAVLNAKRAGLGPGWQMAEQCEAQGAGELVQLGFLHSLQALGKHLRPADVLLAGRGYSSLCRMQGCGIDLFCCCLKLFTLCDIDHI
jgi:hypothetical protein